MTAPLPVFYNDKQSVASKTRTSFSPSAAKPRKLMDLLEKSKWIDIHSNWRPLEISDVKRVHDSKYVDGIMDLTIPNGFGDVSREISDSLLWTTGSFYNAARHAIANRTMTMSPTSGFHHAEYNSAGGFCTFNGLMTAAALLTEEPGVGSIGIVDFDAHWGNGTGDIVDHLGLSNITHLSLPRSINAEGVEGADDWIGKLAAILEQSFSNTEVLLYQAGADPHINDPLGGYLTTEQLRTRDKIVFSFARERDIPLVWDLAGGYQEPFSRVLRIHLNTVEECVRVLNG